MHITKTGIVAARNSLVSIPVQQLAVENGLGGEEIESFVVIYQTVPGDRDQYGSEHEDNCKEGYHGTSP